MNDGRPRNREAVRQAIDKRWAIAATGQDRELLQRTEARKLLECRPLGISARGAEVACPWCAGRHVVQLSELGRVIAADCGRGELRIMREIREG
jgi:hypothetical protein